MTFSNQENGEKKFRKKIIVKKTFIKKNSIFVLRLPNYTLNNFNKRVIIEMIANYCYMTNNIQFSFSNKFYLIQ